MQDFGFPRVRIPIQQAAQSASQSVKANSGKAMDEGIESFTQLGKQFKWKKINYKTFLPKHAPIVAYIVAKTNNLANYQYMMHACAHSKEFDKSYT